MRSALLQAQTHQLAGLATGHGWLFLARFAGETTGDGKFSPDASGIAPATLRLRSEREGHADGRVYLIISTATDTSGNKGFKCCTVTVPHSNSRKAISGLNSQA